MERPVSVHPADETLVSYGLGKLDDTLAESVNKHLEQCNPCRQRVAELSSDSFLERIRDANPQPGDAPARPKTIVEPDPTHQSRVATDNPPKSAVSRDGKAAGDSHGAATRPKAAQPEAASSKSRRPAEPTEAAISSTSNTALPSELANHPQYEVLRELGRGGMGVVYLARNKLMDRLEVLKVLNKEMLAKQGRSDRFLREIQSAARLHHPNVVAAYTALQIGDLLVFAMEYVEGDDLAKLVRARGPLPVINACYFAYQAAQGLQHAHECGMIHRDIKPGNLILFRQGKKGIVKILDFGLAKVTSERGMDRALTQEGQMLGTPDYIAPEQTLDAQKADIRADIYSLGCTLYHLLTGNTPFSGNSLYEVLQAHHSVEAKSLNLVRPEVPVELAAVVAKMMAKEPNRRYQTPAEVVQALKPFLKPGGLTNPQPQLSQAGLSIERPKAKSVSPTPTPVDDDPSPSLAPMEAFQPVERWKSLIHFSAIQALSSKSAIREPGWRLPIWTWISAAAVAMLLLGLGIVWAAGVFRIKTAEGVIVLKNLPADAEVLVDGEKVTVNVSHGGGPTEITVLPGERRIQVKKDGFKAFAEQVSLAKGDREILTVRLEPLPIHPSVTETSKPVVTPTTGTEMTKTPDKSTPPGSDGNKSRSATRQIRNFIGHDGAVSRVAFTPDGQDIVSGSNSHIRVIRDGRGYHPAGDDNTVRLWNLATGRNQFVMKEHDWDIRALAIAPDGRYAASCSGWIADYSSKLTLVWNLKTGRRMHRLEKKVRGGSPWAIAVNFSSDLRRLINAYTDGTIQTWDLDKEREIGSVKLQGGSFKNDEFNCAAFTSDGGRLVTGNGAGLVELWDTQTGKSLQVFSGHTRPVRAIQISSDGSRILSGAADRTVRVWDAVKGQELKKLVGHGHAVVSVSLSPDGHRALSGSNDTTVRLWDLDDGRELCQLVGHLEGVNCVAFSPDGRLAASGSADKSIRLWELSRPGELDISPDAARVPGDPMLVTKTAAQAGWESLFNGLNQTGWTLESSESKSWTVTDGALVSPGEEENVANCLLSTKDYSDFQLRFDYQLESKGIAAVAIRGIPDEKINGRAGHPMVMLPDSPGGLDNGSSRWLLDNRFMIPDQTVEMHPAGSWNQFEMTVRERQIRVSLNGSQVLAMATKSDVPLLDGGVSGLNRKAGRIGLIKMQVPPFVHNTIRFRNIEIKDLSPSAMRMSAADRVTLPKTPSVTSDRSAAQAVSTLGGTVTIRVNDKEQRIEPGQPLPDEVFSLLRIELHDKPDLTDADLEPLEGIANLTSFDVRKVPKVTDAIVGHLRNSLSLESFWFEDGNVGDPGLQYLERFTNLKSLGLRNTKVSDDGLAHLDRLTQLEHVALGGSRITSAGLIHLRGLTRLGRLWIENTKITDSGLAHLQGLSNLKDLILFGTRIGDSGVAYLKGLSQLEYLDLSGLQVTDAGFAHLSHLTHLKTLWMKETRITDAGTVYLSRLSNLERLGIQGTRLTDAGLIRLKTLVNLKMLLMDHTSITAEGFQAFEKARTGHGAGAIPARNRNRNVSSRRSAHSKPLFNHKDLKGWTCPYGNDNEWTVSDGVLVGSASDSDLSMHLLKTTGTHYRDFHLHMSVRNQDPGNKWIVFRLSGTFNNLTHYRFDTGGQTARKTIAPLGRYGATSGTDGLTEITGPQQPPLSVDDDFHKVEVIAKKNEFQMIVDGQVVSAFRDEKSRFDSGSIAINLRPQGRIEIRDIELQDLSTD